jgi:hypothetical protein
MEKQANAFYHRSHEKRAKKTLILTKTSKVYPESTGSQVNERLPFHFNGHLT